MYKTTNIQNVNILGLSRYKLNSQNLNKIINKHIFTPTVIFYLYRVCTELNKKNARFINNNNFY